MATKVKEELTQSPEQIRDEALIKMGDDAERLLKDETFINIINSLAESTYAQFVNSKLEDKELRDQIYAQYRGLTDIMGTLNQRVSVRNQIVERDSNEEE
jgi:ethanolamine ammonia-lyase large subunit